MTLYEQRKSARDVLFRLREIGIVTSIDLDEPLEEPSSPLRELIQNTPLKKVQELGDLLAELGRIGTGETGSEDVRTHAKVEINEE